ncbi:MAG: hypothetical protein WC069_01570 [Candidatus Shapirobacteria bacterium]
MENKNNTDYIAVFLITVFFILLSYAGYLSYKSIDFNVLKNVENAPLGVPSPIPTISIATPSVKK